MKLSSSSRCDLHRVADLLKPSDQAVGGKLQSTANHEAPSIDLDGFQERSKFIRLGDCSEMIGFRHSSMHP